MSCKILTANHCFIHISPSVNQPVTPELLDNKPYNSSPCSIISFCYHRSGSGPHRCQSGQPRGVAASCESALWTFRTASDRKPADASWLPNEQRLSDRTQQQRGQTASRSTSLKPRHDFEVQGFTLILPSSTSISTQHQLVMSHPAFVCCPSTLITITFLLVVPAEATLGKI